MGRAAIYARVSTRNGQNPEMQLEELRAYCGRRQWQIAGEYVDQGISGAKEQHPALNRLLADCRKRLVDDVVVYPLRPFRSELAPTRERLGGIPHPGSGLHQRSFTLEEFHRGRDQCA